MMELLPAWNLCGFVRSCFSKRSAMRKSGIYFFQINSMVDHHWFFLMTCSCVVTLDWVVQLYPVVIGGK